MTSFEIGNNVLGIGTDHLYTGEIVGHIRPGPGQDVYYVKIDDGQYNGGQVKQFAEAQLRMLTPSVKNSVERYRRSETETKKVYSEVAKGLGFDIEAEKKTQAEMMQKLLGQMIGATAQSAHKPTDVMYS